MRDAIHNPETISFARAVVGTRLGWVLNVGGEEGIERLQAPARSVMVDFNSVSQCLQTLYLKLILSRNTSFSLAGSHQKKRKLRAMFHHLDPASGM